MTVRPLTWLFTGVYQPHFVSPRVVGPTSAAPQPASLPAPEHGLEDVAVDASGPARLVVRILLPSISSAAEADVHISRDSLQVRMPGLCALTLALPCSVDEGSAKAKWVKARKELLITLPKR